MREWRSFGGPARRRLPSPFRYVERRRRLLHRFLRALDLDNELQCDLAESLVECAGGQPCGISFCPLCIRDLRQHCRSAVTSYVAALDYGTDGKNLAVTRFTAQPQLYPHTIPSWQVHALPLDEAHRLTRPDLEAFHAPAVFAWLDPCIHHDAARDRDPFCQVHIEGAVLGLSVAKVRRALEPLWPPDRFATETFSARSFSSFSAAVEDCIKLRFSRYVHRKTKSGHRISRALRVRRNEARDLERLLASYDLSDRFILLGEGGGDLPLRYALPENQNKVDWR